MMNYELENMEAIEFMRTLENKSVDAIILDLPYGTTACSWDEIIPFALMWEQVNRINKGAFVTTACQPFTSKLIMSNIEQFKYEWIWKKTRNSNPYLATIQPLRHHENILVFSENSYTYNPQMKREKFSHVVNNGSGRVASDVSGNKWDGTSKASNEKFPQSVIEYSNPSMAGIDHPTQKPVALFEYLIRTYTNEGDTVLDFCMGSGTTGVAAMRTKRNFIGCDSDKEHGYFATAERRIKQAAAQEVMFT